MRVFEGLVSGLDRRLLVRRIDAPFPGDILRRAAPLQLPQRQQGGVHLRPQDYTRQERSPAKAR